jgi:hypothetical protein
MFGLVRTAVRFFFIGFGVGVLLAPRAGAETRELIRRKFSEVIGSVLEIADLPPVSQEGGDGASRGAQTAPGRTRRRSADTVAGAPRG